MRPLFETFRKAVLALDPCVSEEISEALRCLQGRDQLRGRGGAKEPSAPLAQPALHELHDPRSLAKDVTNLGRWGNGDVEVGLSTPDELPYVMGLVRQAFERQMGDRDGDA